MNSQIGRSLLKQATTDDRESKSVTIRISPKVKAILDRWPLGHSLRERAEKLIVAADEYLTLLRSEESRKEEP